MEKKMIQSEVIHDTFSIENTYGVPPAEAFAAFAMLDKKKQWYADSDTYDVLKYDMDFRVGGSEVLIGKMLPETPVAGAILKWSSVFTDVKPNDRIIFSQVVEMNDWRISCSLITVEFLAATAGCLVRLTHQAVYFEGADGPEMRKMGWDLLLNKLGSQLSER
jgi:uncharacterized protein YndB with AHSA1/START domain